PIPVGDDRLGAALTRIAELEAQLAEANQRIEWASAALHGDPLFGAGAFDPLYAGFTQIRNHCAEAESRRMGWESHASHIAAEA
ncbi:hypothetical protein LW979_17705, partial [Erwinia amylovora]|uniref:hypothetical protein n=1 Tax=Erwinia amylovora TaxID=552 RepID=UPI0020BF0907